jgi:D-glycero-D-manno-heptose 1,7-bisphosphate phosphatase
MLAKVVFVDRDGVINRDAPDYILSWAQFEFLPGSRRALARLKRAGFTTIVITNQSAVGRGMIRPAALDDLHARMCAAVREAGGEIRDIFYCPHHPEDDCTCRKPRPGLIWAAQKRHAIDLAGACMVGDSARDIAAARAAGVGLAVLVRTGNGAAAEKALSERQDRPQHVAADLAAAVDWIIAHDPLRAP